MNDAWGGAWGDAWGGAWGGEDMDALQRLGAFPPGARKRKVRRLPPPPFEQISDPGITDDEADAVLITLLHLH